jgi:hypothetical protein
MSANRRASELHAAILSPEKRNSRQNREIPGSTAAMKLPADVQFDEKVRLFIWRPQGLINESTVNKIITTLGEMEARFFEPFNRFSDTSAAEAADLNFKYIFHISLFRRLSYRGPPIKSAILATTETHLHYSKLHAILTQGSPIKVRIFQELAAAATWLAVPVDLLQARSASQKAET